MIIRSIPQRLRPSSAIIGSGSPKQLASGLHLCWTRHLTTIPVTTWSSPITPKYPDPALFDPLSQPKINRVPDVAQGIVQTSTVPSHIIDPIVPVTLYSFPAFAPLQLLKYPATHLHLPLRRDLLHKAITFEGDAAHQWTRWTPHRKDHPGSSRKLMPQKGQGRARIGDASSPLRAKGIKPFGPKPRDMATKLPRKMYDRAWRTALSWRYRKGELIVVDKIFHNEMAKMDKIQVARFVETFNGHDVGSAATLWTDRKEEDKKAVRTTWILAQGGQKRKWFEDSMAVWWPKDKVRDSEKVDVKNLLEGQRVVIEKKALDEILRQRQADLPRRIDWEQFQAKVEADGPAMQHAMEEMKQLRDDSERAARDTLKLLRAKDPQSVELETH